jgi:hemolysin activation/secretion protein
VDLSWSPGQWLPHQSNKTYGALRPDAKNHWLIGRGSLKYTHHLPWNFDAMFLARGQLSSQNLLPIEQIGLGGFNTVRGYTERQLNYDSGVLSTFELHFPKLPVFSAKRDKQFHDDLECILFLDGGYGSNHNLLPGEPNSGFIAGTGPGLRYNYHPYINASLDWGIKLHESGLFIGGASMLFMNVNVSY